MIELYKIFAGKYDSEITEWITGKCIERQYNTRNEILRILATGKEKHIQRLMTTVQLHAQVISDELTAMLHSLFLEISRADIRTTDINYSLLTF